MDGKAQWLRRALSCWGFVVVVGSLGLLAFVPILVAAVRIRRRSVWFLAVAYMFADVLLIVLPEPPPETGPFDFLYVGILLCVVAAACVHVNRFRQELLARVRIPGAVHHALFSVDVEGFGNIRRDNEAFVRVRHTLFRHLEDAFEHAGVTWSSCVRHDTGDGMIVIIPARFPKARLIYPLLERLSMALRQHNRYAAPSVRIRLRVAVHAGDVLIDEFGVTGRPKVLLARLLDAEPTRAALAAAPDSAPVAVIVSDFFYRDVICQGYEGIEARLFRPVRVQVKETEERAWLHVLGHEQPGEGIGGTESPDPDRFPRVV